MGQKRTIDEDGRIKKEEEKISDFFHKRIDISSDCESASSSPADDIENLVYQTKKHRPSVHFESLNVSGVPIKYPFKPYPSQIQLMDKVTTPTTFIYFQL